MPRHEIISFIDNHAREQLEFIIDLCNQNSYTYNKPGTDSVAGMILHRLQPLFPLHQVVNQARVGCHHIFRNRNAKQAIYIIGHMDTVFPPDHEFQMCREEGGLLFGPGTCDMKGGLGVIVYALMALHEAKALDMMNIVVILNGDEEIGSVTSQSLFEQERENAAACLAAECAGQNGEIVVSRNGKMGARLDCYGEDRHVSGGSHDKASAILELSRQIIALEELNASLPGVSVNVGRAEGGLGPSTVPGHAYALLDVRWTDEKHRPILEDAIAKNLPRHSQPGCRSTFTVLNSRPAMPQHQQTESLFRLIHETSHSLGQSINPEHRRGTSDVNYFGAAGVAAADGFGPVGYKDHTADEHIEIESLGGRTSLLAHVLLDLCQEQ